MRALDQDRIDRRRPLSDVGIAIVTGGIGAFSMGVFAPITEAEPEIMPGITVLTIVKWSGSACIRVRTATGERELCDPYQQPPGEAIIEHGKAIGDLVGADPVMGHAGWISCQVFLNGSPHMSDVALAGDGSDVTCLTVLR
jgi:hypothetical protein